MVWGFLWTVYYSIGFIGRSSSLQDWVLYQLNLPTPFSCPPESPQQPLLHLHLLLFALQTFLTTAVCIVEYHSWPELSAGERPALGGLYVPYLGFGEFLCFLFFCFLKWL